MCKMGTLLPEFHAFPGSHRKGQSGGDMTTWHLLAKCSLDKAYSLADFSSWPRQAGMTYTEGKLRAAYVSLGAWLRSNPKAQPFPLSWACSLSAVQCHNTSQVGDPDPRFNFYSRQAFHSPHPPCPLHPPQRPGEGLKDHYSYWGSFKPAWDPSRK